MNSRIPFLIVCVVLVLTLMGFALYYVQSSSTISFEKAKNTSLTGRNTALEAQLEAANAQITTLRGQLNSANAQIAALQAQVTTGTGQISSLETQTQQAKAQVASLQTQLQQANNRITVLQSQVASMQTELSTANATAASLQSQVASLQSQLDTANASVNSLTAQVSSLQAIINLQISTNVTSFATVSATAPSTTVVASFNAPYAGYLLVSGNSTSAGYVTVTCSFSGYPYNSSQYAIGTVLTTWLVPILPGTVTISYGTSSGSSTATITVYYHY